MLDRVCCAVFAHGGTVWQHSGSSHAAMTSSKASFLVTSAKMVLTLAAHAAHSDWSGLIVRPRCRTRQRGWLTHAPVGFVLETLGKGLRFTKAVPRQGS